MTQSEAIKVFEQRDIRSLWDDEAETWFSLSWMWWGY